MDITMFLAQMWGPVMFAVGLGFFLSRTFYRRVYRDLDKSPFTLLVFGMIATAAGIAHVQVHNMWGTGPEILISLFGWSLLIKGLLTLVCPRFAIQSADVALKAKLFPLSGLLALILGAYLCWIGYLI